MRARCGPGFCQVFFLFFFTKNPAFRRGLRLRVTLSRLRVCEHRDLFASANQSEYYAALRNTLAPSDFRIFQAHAFNVFHTATNEVCLNFMRKDLVWITLREFFLHTFNCARDLRERVGVLVVCADHVNEVIRGHASIIAQKTCVYIRYFHAKRN